jgi:hypothetical protein
MAEEPKTKKARFEEAKPMWEPCEMHFKVPHGALL